MIMCKKFLISGHVQGVFFRISTQQQALNLAITGYAKNLFDGKVEVLACGKKEKVEILADWLLHGPSGADVRNITAEVIADKKNPENFVTR